MVNHLSFGIPYIIKYRTNGLLGVDAYNIYKTGSLTNKPRLINLVPAHIVRGRCSSFVRVEQESTTAGVLV